MNEKDQLDELQKKLDAALRENWFLKSEERRLSDELRKHRRADKLDECLAGTINTDSGISTLQRYLQSHSKDIAETNRTKYYVDELQKRIDRLNLIVETILEAERQLQEEEDHRKEGE